MKRFAQLFCALSLALLLLSWARHLDTPFARVVGFSDWIGNENGRFAWNHVRYGFAETRGAQIRNLEVAPPADRLVYHAHPATLDVLVGAVFTVLGHKAPWAHRLVPLLASLIALVLLARLARELGLDPPLVVGVFALLPMTNVHGVNLSYEPLCLAAMLWIVLLHRRGLRFGLAPWIWLFGLFDYPVLYLAPFFAGMALLGRERTLGWRLRYTGILALACLASIGTHLLHLLWSMGGLRGGHGPSWGEYILGVLRQGAASLPEFSEFVRVQLEWLQQGYTVPLLLSFVAGVFLALRRPALRVPVLAFVFVGGLHLVAFPAHAWRHDFWLCYFAPGVALASAVLCQRAHPGFTPFLLCAALVLGHAHSERIWSERESPEVERIGRELKSAFDDEAVLFAFRTPATWALEFFREHPVHEAERLLLPGEEALHWASLIDQLGSLAQLERPMFAVLPERSSEHAALLDRVFPGARVPNRGGYLVWDVRHFVLAPGRSPYFRERIGDAGCEALARRVQMLRAVVLVPVGARLHVLAPEEHGATWFRTRELRAGPWDSIPEEDRFGIWLLAPAGGAEAGELARRRGEHRERSIDEGLRFLVAPPRR